jgi:hypothetical protein
MVHVMSFDSDEDEEEKILWRRDNVGKVIIG